MALASISRINWAPSQSALASLESGLAALRIAQSTSTALTPTFRRHASHQAQGRANGAKDGPGKRLGSKKTAGEYVVTGNIIYKQRGTLWFPGDNCFMGRDHTIHAGSPGYVTYYRDPDRHPKRKYIGVVFERGQTLPQPANAVRRRRLGMLAHQMPSTEVEQTTGDLTYPAPPDAADMASAPATFISDAPNEVRSKKAVKKSASDAPEIKLTLRPGYMYRESNWEIGRAAERSKEAQMVKPFKPRDRFVAWRKRTLRRARAMERKAMVKGGKKKK